MHPISSTFFGSSGIKCVFAIDDAGNTDVGYIVKQVGTRRFVITNGSVTKTCSLAQKASDVTSLTNLTPGLCTILLTPLGASTPEHIRYIAATKCVTIESNTYAWHLGSATPGVAQITAPSQTVGYAEILPVLSTDMIASVAYFISPDGRFIVGSVKGTDYQWHTIYWLDGVPNYLLPGIFFQVNDCTNNIAVGTMFFSDKITAGYWNGGDPIALLPTDGEYFSSTAYGCSYDGKIVGYCEILQLGVITVCPVVWQDGNMQLLPMLSDTSGGKAIAISFDGQIVVGYLYLPINNGTMPTYWLNGVLNLLQTLPDDISARPTMCSTDGSIIGGYAVNNVGQSRDIYWKNGQIIDLDLPLLPGGSYAWVNKMSNNIFVGTGDDANGDEWPVIWRQQPDWEIFRLARLSGSSDGYPGEAIAISADGKTIVGDGDDANGNDLAIIWRL